MTSQCLLPSQALLREPIHNGVRRALNIEYMGLTIHQDREATGHLETTS